MRDGTQLHVVKFQQVFEESDPPNAVHLVELREWRNRLHQWDLIGEYPDGTGYGNVSYRVPPYLGACRFVISGTQTGADDFLGRSAYATVLEIDVGGNSVVATGKVHASSEALTHGVVYDAVPSVRYVFHAHNPEIWTSRSELDLLETRPGIAYGTPQMAEEVRRLFRETDVAARGVFAMAGHQDGLLSFGTTAVEAGSILRVLLTRARELRGRMELQSPQYY